SGLFSPCRFPGPIPGGLMLDRAAELRADYDLLGKALRAAEGSAAAAIARERRLIGAELEKLEVSEEVPLVQKLAVKRAASKSSRPPARRRKSR
ncbi:MAG TPA: hypothetical protein VJQ79_05990, partial [Acidimicrobiia bacterium]|nr:hypothetical protein [Acidimicrobiia bacterium]